MGKAEPSIPARIATVETHQQHILGRLESLDAIERELSGLKERTARLEERRAVQTERSETGIASSTLFWTKVGVGVAVVVSAIAIILGLLGK